MTRNISLTIEGKVYSITVSDDQKALLAAAAAGRAVLGLWDPEKPEEMPWGVPYLAEKGQETDRDLLERVVRRHAGLPWIIGEGRRLWLRELKEEDWIFIQEFSQERDCPPAFSNKEAFLSYIHSQYRFYEYGLWGVIHRQKDVLLGAAGIWDFKEGGLETGYWIRKPFRRQGYGQEAEEIVLDYTARHFQGPVWAAIREENLPSRRLAQKLGFVRKKTADLGKERNIFLYQLPERTFTGQK